jgi:hypothetical protein
VGHEHMKSIFNPEVVVSKFVVSSCAQRDPICVG